MAGITEFVERRRSSWERLNEILLRAGSREGVKRLSRDDLKALGPLYRRASSDLAYVRLRGDDSGITEYLNELVTRAHGLLYADQGPGWARLWKFIADGLPRLMYRRRSYIFAAFAIFTFGGILGAALTYHDPSVGPIFLGERANETTFYKDLPDTLKDGERPTFAAVLMTNNIRVGFLAFAFGIAGGLPSLLLLFYNGLPIGSLAVLQQKAGYSVELWSFILPHGILELFAIFVAGAAGMIIGHAVVAPGELTRRDALTLAAQDAVCLIMGTAGMLVIAGMIESFISPTALPPAAKFVFAAFMTLALAAYLKRGNIKNVGEQERIPAPR
jgi:uncharacterized membrane protein SpoIIM required for sporulation